MYPFFLCVGFLLIFKRMFLVKNLEKNSEGDIIYMYELSQMKTEVTKADGECYGGSDDTDI